MTNTIIGEVSWERMVRAVEKVRERLLRASAALDAAGIPYAVAGGNAVAACVSRVDEAAVRNTRDVDRILRRGDFEAATQALERVGCYAGLEGPAGKTRDGVHILFAGEKVRPDYVTALPDVTESESAPDFTLVALEPLVRMKLTSSGTRTECTCGTC